jgi:hypothetical protein
MFETLSDYNFFFANYNSNQLELVSLKLQFKTINVKQNPSEKETVRSFFNKN